MRFIHFSEMTLLVGAEQLALLMEEQVPEVGEEIAAGELCFP